MLSKLGSHLKIGDNPWEEPPEAVVNKGMPAVSEYFADLFAEGATIRRSMIKVVLVGQEGSGKTRCAPARLVLLLEACFGVVCVGSCRKVDFSVEVSVFVGPSACP